MFLRIFSFLIVRPVSVSSSSSAAPTPAVTAFKVSAAAASASSFIEVFPLDLLLFMFTRMLFELRRHECVVCISS